MAYQCRIVESIKSVDRKEWNNATRGPYSSYEWFEYIEELSGDELIPHYILCYDDDQLVGVLPTFCPETSENSYENYLFGRLNKWFLRLKFVNRMPLICFLPYAGGAYVFSDNNYTEDVLRQLIWTFEKTARENGMSEVVFLFIKETEGALIEHLEKRGYEKVYLNSVGIIENRFQRFEDYLMSLSRRRRESVRRDISKFRNSQYTIEVTREENPDIQTICRLRDNISRKYPSVNSNLTPQAVALCFEKMTPYRTHYFVKSDDECIGALTIFEKDNLVNTYGFGLDFDKARVSRTYFSLLYYSTIREMVERKAAYINFNQMAYKVKEARGCELVRQYMYIKVLKGRAWMKPWLRILDWRYQEKFRNEYDRDEKAFRGIRPNRD